jgi:acid stress-induced BolA-like protein IbaG/YrbA
MSLKPTKKTTEQFPRMVIEIERRITVRNADGTGYVPRKTVVRNILSALALSGRAHAVSSKIHTPQKERAV